MGAGKRRQIRKQICDILTEFVVTAYFEKHVEGSTLYSTAREIMRLFPKPEKTTFHIKETPSFRIKYYVCGKCKGILEESPLACGMLYCPYCARRILAMEDDTICQ